MKLPSKDNLMRGFVRQAMSLYDIRELKNLINSTIPVGYLVEGKDDAHMTLLEEHLDAIIDDLSDKIYFISDICEPEKTYVGTIFEGKLDTPLSFEEWFMCLETDIKCYCQLYNEDVIAEHFIRSVKALLKEGSMEINGMRYYLSTLHYVDDNKNEDE